MRIKEFITICLLLVSVSLFAQEKTIEVTGVVTDMNKEPLVGVNVTVKDKPGLGAITDINGRYKINIEEFSRLVFSYIGFDTQEILVKHQNLVNVSMKESEAREIDEVVITGTGAQKKLTVTGAVTNVDVEVLKSNPTANLSNALAGNVSGVLAMQTSGQPGVNTSEFWIRGISTFGANSSALVLVDGFERDLDEINIEDIESFTVLKDASTTAIYGSRGANGVVLITTKHGKEGKIKINAKVETSYNARTITPEFADGYSYAMLMNEACITRNQERIYQNDEMEILRLGLDPDLYPNVDWMDVLLKDGAMTYRANLNMSGGGSTARYFVSLSYVNEEGMYKTDDAMRKDYNTNPSSQRWNYRLNTDIDVTKTTLVKVGVSGSLKKRNAPGQGSNVWTSLMGQSPISIPVMYSNGYIPAHGKEDNRNNPWVLATQSGYKEIWNNKIQTNISLEQKLDFITKGLRFEGRFGFDTNNQSEINRIRMPETWRAQRDRNDEGKVIFNQQSAEKPMEQTSASTGERREFLEAFLQYNRAFHAHHLSGTLKYSQDAYRTTVDIGTDVKNGIAKRHMGLAGRVSYNWNYRYFADFNFGYNGSENFADGHRFGFFPAFSLAWNIAEETFIKKHLKWMNMFKLRYSYGKVGNDVVGDNDQRFPYLSTFGASGGFNYADIGQKYEFTGLSYTHYATTAVTWEIATKHDIGIDFSLWDDKFTGTIDYFHEQRDGIYQQRNFIPISVGLNGAMRISTNIGSVLSKGFDGNFGFKQRIGDVNLTLRGNFTYSKSEILEYDEEYSNYPYKSQRGFRVDQTRGLIALGLFKDYDDIRNSPKQSWGDVMPGDIKYRDVNGDGKINSKDQVMISQYGNVPRIQYGIGLDMTYKSFDFGMFFNGSAQRTIMVSGIMPFRGDASTGDRNVMQFIANDYWSEANPNPDAKFPRLGITDSQVANNSVNSTYWMHNGRFIRFKTLELGYSFPYCRVYINGDNLAVWSPFKEWDPELSWNAYPLQRTINIGVQLKF